MCMFYEAFIILTIYENKKLFADVPFIMNEKCYALCVVEFMKKVSICIHIRNIYEKTLKPETYATYDVCICIMFI